MSVVAGLRYRHLAADILGLTPLSFSEKGRKNISSDRNFDERWMRSFNCSRALTSCNSTSVEQSLSSKWMLGDGSLATFCSSTGVSTTSCVDVTDRRRRKPRCSSSLSSSFERQKRRKETSRGKMSTVKVAVGGWALPALDHNTYKVREQALLTGEGPSCIFVGPLEKAEKVRLEALYQQARDSYYSGSPLIVDDMFDRVEIRLRWHGSKLVLKYPRCSLKRFSAYADAEVDSSQMLALGSIWSILLASGLMAASFPPACAFNKACRKAFNMNAHEATSTTDAMMAMNGALAVGLGLVIGIPVAVAAARSLQGLWRGDLMALKGGCPNCGEEVYAFVNADAGELKTECHVCEHPLVFRVNVERSKEHRGGVWAYGRVYLSIQSKDLTPKKEIKKGIKEGI